jgi:hypothetical protein
MAPPPTTAAMTPPPTSAMAPILHELDPVLPFERVVGSDRASLIVCARNSLWLGEGNGLCKFRGSGDGRAPDRHKSDAEQHAP